MQSEPRISFRGMEPSPAVEAVVRERIDRLEQFHDRIISCSVVIEAPHRGEREVDRIAVEAGWRTDFDARRAPRLAETHVAGSAFEAAQARP